MVDVVEFKPEIKCECMDAKTIYDLKAALLTARKTIEGMAEISKNDKAIKAYKEKAISIHKIFEEVKKIKPC